MSDLLILSAADVERSLSPSDCIAAIEAMLRAASGERLRTFVSGVAVPDGRGKFHVKAALDADAPARFVAKINANYPDNPARGLPTIQGVVALFDAADGRLLALMDSASLTAIRTAAATAIAARYLANPAATTLAIIGCGAQARAQVEAVAAVRHIRRVHAFDRDADRARTFRDAVQAGLGVEATVAAAIADATRAADIVVTCTSSSRPILRVSDVRPGAFVGAVGADNPDKQEIDPELLAQSLVIVDDLEQSAASGDLHHALAAGRVTREHVAGSLADLVRTPDRFEWRAGRVTLFDSTGIPIEDVAAAARAYEVARQTGVGQRTRLA